MVLISEQRRSKSRAGAAHGTPILVVVLDTARIAASVHAAAVALEAAEALAGNAPALAAE